MTNATSNWNLSAPSENKTIFYGRVTKSKVEPASAEYIAANGRAGDQWVLELEYLYPFVYEGENRGTRSQNMPRRGQAPRVGTALLGRYEAFKALGYDMPTENDFPLIEGHIFRFEDSERQFGKFSKRDFWPLEVIDNFEAPDAPEVYGQEGGGSSGASSVDVWGEAAKALAGSTAGKQELMAIMKNSRAEVQGNQQVMGLVQKNTLYEELVKKDLITVDEKTKVISLKGAGTSNGTSA